MIRIFTIKLILLFSVTLYGQSALDYYMSIPDSLLPEVDVIVPYRLINECDSTHELWNALDTQKLVLKKRPIYKFISGEEQPEAAGFNIDQNENYFKFVIDAAGVVFIEGKSFNNNSIQYLGFTYCNTNLPTCTYQTFFYKIEKGKYESVEVLPELTYKDFFINGRDIEFLKEYLLTTRICAVYQFNKLDNSIRAYLTQRYSDIAQEIAHVEDNNNNVVDPRYSEFIEIIKSDDRKKEILLNWDEKMGKYTIK